MLNVEQITRELIMTKDQLNTLQSSLVDEMNLGLAKATNDEARIKMYPTYVRDVPDGTEKGRFLALDLGGTNFRVLLIEIDGPHFDMESEIYAVPQEVMLGSGQQVSVFAL